MKIVIFGALLFTSYSIAADLPSKGIRSKIFESMVSKMEHLDGEALYVRRNRTKSWKAITSDLKKEAEDASTWFDFMRSFTRLDQAYPNLHSYAKPGNDYKSYIPNRIEPKVSFVAEWLDPHNIRYVVSNIESDVKYSSDNMPKIGDEIVAINGRDVKHWKAENFEGCKFPRKDQCDFLLPTNFQKEFLSWTRKLPLSYILKRGQNSWTIPVEIKESKPTLGFLPNEYCKHENNRYQERFQLVYAGNRACIYESPNYPGIAILRITSFNYSKDSLEKNEAITSVATEIDALYPWWKVHATWSHLIIDVIDNHGGQAPIEYYKILFQQDFQEQYVTFKKTLELENPTLRASIFWGDSAHEIWFQNLLKNGLWDKLPYNAYTPPTPMFCVDETKNCSSGGLFPAKEHPFRGRVSVLLNQWCVSSCDGFAYNIKEKLGSKARYFGHPQAADTAYSRVTINVTMDPSLPDGFKLDVVPIRDLSGEKAFMSQTVVVSRSTLQDGTIVSGTSVPLDGFTPFTLQNMSSWPNQALKQALQ